MLTLSRYQIAVIILIYLLPLLVMLVTYSMVGQRLWGSKIPGEASDHYQNQIQAKRKVRFKTCFTFTPSITYYLKNEPVN